MLKGSALSMEMVTIAISAANTDSAFITSLNIYLRVKSCNMCNLCNETMLAEMKLHVFHLASQ